MKPLGLRRVVQHLVSHSALYLSALVVVATLGIAALFPVYFRTDDVRYLEWASSHGNPLSAFHPSQAVLFGVFRPLQNLTWWSAYRLFGLQPMPYQILVTALYGFSLVLFYKAAERAFSWKVALASLVAYALVFSYLAHISFWFSDLTYVLEMFFTNLSLYFIVSAIKGRTGLLLLGGVSYACAGLSKEPAIVIVPAVGLAFLWSTWDGVPDPKRRVIGATLAAFLCAGLVWSTAGPFLRRRQGLDWSAGPSEAWAFVSRRWRFYARRLTSELGVLIWIATIYLGWRVSVRGRGWSVTRSVFVHLGGSVVVAMALSRVPDVALLVLFALFVYLVARRDEASLGAVWGGLPLVGALTVSYMVRTYLVEASFGLALIVGLAIAHVAHRLSAEERRLRPRPVAAIVAVSVLVLALGVALILPKFGARLDALCVVSATRQNLRSVVEVIASGLADDVQHVVVVDYEDMGLAYVDDVLRLPELAKAHRQKTMNADQLQRFLALAGVSTVAVHDVAWLRDNEDAAGVLLLAMNNSEYDFLAGLNLPMDLAYVWQRCGTGAWLFRVGT